MSGKHDAAMGKGKSDLSRVLPVHVLDGNGKREKGKGDRMSKQAEKVATIKTPARVYHSINLNKGGGSAERWLKGDQEEITLTFEATWRGRPVVVDMMARRYVAGRWDEKTNKKLPDAWTEFQVYSSGAWDVPPADSGRYRGDELTGTARARLSDELKPSVMAWLGSDDYGTSESEAYGRAVQREFSDMRGRSDTKYVRTALDANREKLREADYTRMVKAADAYDVYVSILSGEEG